MGQSRSPRFERYRSAAALPSLGLATSDTAGTGSEYLVVRKDDPIEVRSVGAVDGGQYYFVDQLANERSITFAPGGLWGDDILIHGRVATVSDAPEAQRLMKQFQTSIRKRFRKVKAFWVGPQAEEFLDAGKRLTGSAQSPREFDLRRDG